jgi:hypothetical protein
MALPVLKYAGVGPMAHWSWLWVLAPVWGPGALLGVIVSIEQVIEAVQVGKDTKTQLVTSHLGLHQMSASVVGQQS